MNTETEKEVKLFRVDFTRVFKTWAIVGGNGQEEAAQFVKETFDPDGEYKLDLLGVKEVSEDEARSLVEEVESTTVATPRPTLQ